MKKVKKKAKLISFLKDLSHIEYQLRQIKKDQNFDRSEGIDPEKTDWRLHNVHVEVQHLLREMQTKLMPEPEAYFDKDEVDGSVIMRDDARRYFREAQDVVRHGQKHLESVFLKMMASATSEEEIFYVVKCLYTAGKNGYLKQSEVLFLYENAMSWMAHIHKKTAEK